MNNITGFFDRLRSNFNETLDHSRSQNFMVQILAIALLLFLVIVISGFIAIVTSQLIFELSFHEPSGPTWWLIFLLIAGIIGTSIYGAYNLIKILILSWFIPLTFSRPKRRATGQIVELAKLNYHLDDPAFSKEFEAFLDSQILVPVGQPITSSTTRDTPRSYIEQHIISYAKDIELKSNGTISIKVDIKRGSIEITLAIFALVNNLGTIYDRFAQWKDITDSANLLRDQAQEVINRTKNWYRQETARDIQVRSDVTIEAIPTTITHENNEVTSNPLISNEPNRNSNISPSSTNNITINLAQPLGLPRALNWITLAFYFTVVAITGSYILLIKGYVHCQMLNNSNVCYEWSLSWAFQLSRFFARISQFFDQLAQSIMP